jgi:rubrerythrin
MKRVVFLSIVAALLFANTAAAQKVICTQNVLAAFAGERDAVARYEASAAKAVEEGYLGAAALFRAAAKAEQIHAGRFASVIKDRGVEVPAGGTAAPVIGTTVENLRAAATAERAERDGTYRDAIDACQKSDPQVAKLFDVTRDAEVEHLNLFSDAAQHADNMKEAATFYVCRVCGYTTNVKLPLCPSCRDQHAMEPVE